MNRFLILSFILFSLIFLNLMPLEKPRITISKQNSSFNFNVDHLKLFNLGFSGMVSSWLWVNTLLESDIEPYRKDDLNSWMFLRFLTIVSIDPKFYEAYLYGGKYLSIIKDDVLGAEIIFNKGLEFYSKDFWLNMNAAHNYFFEMGMPEKAYPLYKKIQLNPEAEKHFKILPSIIAKLEKQQGELQAAFELLSVSLKNQESEFFKRYYENSLYALKAEMDLNCLNNGKLNCNGIDYKGLPYIKTREGFFKAQMAWKKFEFSSKIINRIKKKKEFN